MPDHIAGNAASRIGCHVWARSDASNRGVTTFAEVGCRWVRSTWSLHFDLIASAPGRYDFANHGENSIDAILGQGLSIMGILDGRWGHEMGTDAAPWSSPIWQHLDYWEDFVGRTVEHYRDRIRYWEIMNEPPFFWWYPPAPGQSWPQVNPPMRRAPIWGYADLLKASARAIRRTDPAARIVVGSGFSDGSFLRRLYELGCRDAFDIASVHYLPCKHPEDFARGMRRLRAVMAEFGDEAKPIWDTENGPAGALIGQAVASPAEYEALYNLYRHCFASEFGLERYFWFNPVQQAAAGNAAAHAGTTHLPDGRLAPAYQAMKTLHELVGDGALLRSSHLGREVHAYVFAGRQGPVTLLWATAPATAWLRAGAEGVTHLGEPVALKGEVKLSGRPLLLRGDLLAGGAFEARLDGARETVVAPWANKRARPDAPCFASRRLEQAPASGDDAAWAALPVVAARAAVAVPAAQDHFCEVSSSVAAELQLAHTDEYLLLRVRTFDERFDPANTAGLVQFTLRDANPDIAEWSYFYNSYALFNLYACRRGAMFLRFDPLFPDAYPAGRVGAVRVTARPHPDGLLFEARIPWEELGPCRPGQHNPCYMMFGFHRADGLLDVPPGDTPEEWPHNFNDTFIVKPPATALQVTFA